MNGKLDYRLLQPKLDTLVDNELDIFIYHELGEKSEETFDSKTHRAFLARFPGSVIEFVCRTVKDLLADTHPKGLLSYLIEEKRHSGAGFYVAFLDGLREKLFPEISSGWRLFLDDGDWQHLEQARNTNRQKCLRIAETLVGIAHQAESLSDTDVLTRFCDEILTPLGLDLPET